jgi:hypothetical protein
MYRWHSSWSGHWLAMLSVHSQAKYLQLRFVRTSRSKDCGHCIAESQVVDEARLLQLSPHHVKLGVELQEVCH